MGHARQLSRESRVPSKDMKPLPDNFLPVFIRNQFLTTIELPNRDNTPSAKGKCAVVTGSNTGLGFESCKQLLTLGLSHLVMGVRNMSSGEDAAAKLRAISPSAKIYVWHLDMESYSTIELFVRRCQSQFQRVDIVILNAGIGALKFDTSTTGHEKTIQVNYISTMLLAVLFASALKHQSTSVNAEPPRLVVVNSVTAQLCAFPNKAERPLLPSFDNLEILPWGAQERYGVSKLLGQLFIVRLASIVNASDVTINMVDPGLTKGTGLARDLPGLAAAAVKVVHAVVARPTERGSATYIDAALQQSKASHGCFLMNCAHAPLSKHFYSDDGSLTDTLWEETLDELEFAGVRKIIESLS